MDGREIESLEVAALYQSYPDTIKTKLLALRQMIFDLSETTEDVGEIEETLKWGVPSYLTKSPKSGTTIRLQWKPASSQYGIYVHCQTSLISDFKEEHPTELTYEKNRGILFNENAVMPLPLVSEFLQRALTYHLKKNSI